MAAPICGSRRWSSYLCIGYDVPFTVFDTLASKNKKQTTKQGLKNYFIYDLIQSLLDQPLKTSKHLDALQDI